MDLAQSGGIDYYYWDQGNETISVIDCCVRMMVLLTDHTKLKQFHGRGLLGEKDEGGDEEEEKRERRSGVLCLLFVP